MSEPTEALIGGFEYGEGLAPVRWHPYDFNSGPKEFDPAELQEGDPLNCQLWVHHRLAEEGTVLPAWLRSGELYTIPPTEAHVPIGTPEATFQHADVAFFTHQRRPSDDPRDLHVAFVEAVIPGSGVSLSHASYEVGGTAHMWLPEVTALGYRLVGARRIVG